MSYVKRRFSARARISRRGALATGRPDSSTNAARSKPTTLWRLGHTPRAPGSAANPKGLEYSPLARSSVTLAEQAAGDILPTGAIVLHCVSLALLRRRSESLLVERFDVYVCWEAILSTYSWS